jgi:hypothetical protein
VSDDNLVCPEERGEKMVASVCKPGAAKVQG